ncbi:hypothetical protein V5O48_011722 [Marasmius crinis-equi]|uniref:Cytochrome P450 n=1 Tax=Marasmius crinis-equi TaxID=585013 RepID=A0ABR3F524_9AGAR
MVKDQHAFEEPPVFVETNRLLFGNGLLSALGDHHRKQRKMLNPVFSIAHIRNMVPIFHDVINKLRDTIARKVSSGEAEIDILAWSSRIALELIGQGGLGYSFDPLTDEEHAHPYTEALKELLPLSSRTLWARVWILPLVQVFPPRFLRLLALYTPIRNIQRGRVLSDYMWSVSTEIYQSKLRALEVGDCAVLEQVGRGKDVISVLINENMKASDVDKLDEAEIIGQASDLPPVRTPAFHSYRLTRAYRTLIFAAMDTTSNALARTLQLLSENPDVQAKLREEVRAARGAQGGKDLPYDELVSLPYLDAICRETLRLYAPVARVLRETNKDTLLPLSTPIRCEDGSILSEIPLPANTSIYVSILNSNRNVDLWGPDALEWKPERWLSPLPPAVAEAKIPGVYSHL